MKPLNVCLSFVLIAVAFDIHAQSEPNGAKFSSNGISCETAFEDSDLSVVSGPNSLTYPQDLPVTLASNLPFDRTLRLLTSRKSQRSLVSSDLKLIEEGISPEAFKILNISLALELIEFKDPTRPSDAGYLTKYAFEFKKKPSEGSKDLMRASADIGFIPQAKVQKFLKEVDGISITNKIVDEVDRATQLLNKLGKPTSLTLPTLGVYHASAWFVASMSFAAFTATNSWMNLSATNFSIGSAFSAMLTVLAHYSILKAPDYNLRKAVRSDIDTALGKYPQVRKVSKEIPLAQEIKALPGLQQEELLIDYESITDIANLSSYLASRANQLSLQNKDRNIPDRYSLLITEIADTEIQIEHAMREFLTFEHLPPDAVSCNERLRCRKFNAILNDIIDGEKDLKKRNTKIDKAMKLAQYLTDHLLMARAEAKDLSKLYKDLAVTTNTLLEKAKTESEEGYFIERLVGEKLQISQDKLNYFSSLLERLDSYIENVEVFKEELLRRKGPSRNQAQGDLKI